MINVHIEKKTFGDSLLFKDLYLEVADKEFVSIIGPSGCGKSTLLNMIASLDCDYQGNIVVNTDSIGMLFQEPRLLPWMRVRENIELISKPENISNIDKLLNLVGLSDYSRHFPKHISGGMARRVALVRAFINQPKLILLDEPFVSLDRPTAMLLKKDFLTLCKTFDSTVIMITHDLSEAISMSDRVIFLGNSPTKEIFQYQSFINHTGDLESPMIEKMQKTILKNYPNILEGII